MFSLDRFYNIIHNNLIKPLEVLNRESCYFFPFGTYDNLLVLNDTFNSTTTDFRSSRTGYLICYFFDQEPFYEQTKTELEKAQRPGKFFIRRNRINILANSERSSLLDDFLPSQDYYNWYYFFHGFAALAWYRDFQYIEPQSFNRFDKVFICHNHITSKYRSYRLHLVSNLIEQDLIKHGHVSLFADNWQQTIEDPKNLLDGRARVKIYKTLKDVSLPLVDDTESPAGDLSANINIDTLTSALWHVVPETVYFLPKLHLTEKVFKPIVARRPFLLVAAPGNLAYLKSYGFKTFDRWIDESYDTETDHYIRIEKITEELKKLCALTSAELTQMHTEMQEVLDYNFNHFYGNFKKIIVDELVDNFADILKQAAGRPDSFGEYNNNGTYSDNLPYTFSKDSYYLSPEYLEQVKRRLAS